MKNLNNLGIEHGTGKSSLWVNYLWFYDLLFRSRMLEPVKLLEVGVQFGFSLATWRDYFPLAQITGIDVVSNGLSFSDPLGRIELLIGDAYTHSMLERIKGPFDIMIDDGSHDPSHQLFFVKHYAPKLAMDGLLFVEDILTRDTTIALGRELPAGFEWTCADFTRHSPDGLLFIAWRKPPCLYYA